MPATETKPPLEIKIKLVNGKHVIPTLPDEMRVGQSVHYKSNAGDFELRFPPDPHGFTPFSAGGVTVLVTSKDKSSAIFVLQNPGTFTCHCSLTLSDTGAKVGWPMDGDRSGGNHVVKASGP